MIEKSKLNAPDSNQEHLLAKDKLHISVRNLVEFIFREGDIDNRNGRVPSADAMMQGSRLHRKIQESMGAEYQAEVPLKYSVEEEWYELTIDGRADGVFINEAGLVVIDEIKGVFKVWNTWNSQFMYIKLKRCVMPIFLQDKMHWKKLRYR